MSFSSDFLFPVDFPCTSEIWRTDQCGQQQAQLQSDKNCHLIHKVLCHLAQNIRCYLWHSIRVLTNKPQYTGAGHRHSYGVGQLGHMTYDFTMCRRLSHTANTSKSNTNHIFSISIITSTADELSGITKSMTLKGHEPQNRWCWTKIIPQKTHETQL